MRRNERGGIAVEASIITPIFLALLLFFITFIRMAIIDIALQHAVNETTKQMAAYFYTVDMLVPEQEAQISVTQESSAERPLLNWEKWKEVEKWLREYEAYLPEEISVLLSFKDGIEKKMDELYQQVLTDIFKPLLMRHIDQTLIDHRSLYVTGVVFPNVSKKTNPYVGIELRYDFALPVPFLSRTVSLQKQAYERVWVGDAYLDEGIPDIGEDEQNEQLRIHSISFARPTGAKCKNSGLWSGEYHGHDPLLLSKRFCKVCIMYVRFKRLFLLRDTHWRELEGRGLSRCDDSR